VSLSARDKRALVVLAAAAAVSAAVWFWPAPQAPAVAAGTDDIPAAERRLDRLRQLAASAPAREEGLKRVLAGLAEREKGLIQAETAAQAQAQVLQTLRRVARQQAPPIEFRGFENGPTRAVSDGYGEVLVGVNFEARIEQLVNFLADLTAQPELVATEELRVAAANAKEKTMAVRLTVAGMVPRKLIPEKKGFQF